jgi:hypothetical protein
MKKYKCNVCNSHRFETTLKPGLKVPIYIEDSDKNLKKEGEAVLVRKAKTSFEQEPFPLTMNCEGCKRQVNLIKEKWIVNPTDPFTRHLTYPRWVIRLYSYGDISMKEYQGHPFLEFVEPYCFGHIEDETMCNELKKQLLGKKESTELLDNFIKYMKSG